MRFAIYDLGAIRSEHVGIDRKFNLKGVEEEITLNWSKSLNQRTTSGTDNETVYFTLRKVGNVWEYAEAERYFEHNLNEKKKIHPSKRAADLDEIIRKMQHIASDKQITDLS